jgi:PhnB protein
LDKSYISQGFGAVRPYVYGDLAVWEMVSHAFPAKELARHQLGEHAFHIEAQIEDSVIVLELSDPPHPGGFPGSVYVYVEDVDEVYRIATQHGATTIAAPEDRPFGERQAGVKDTYGNVWWISTCLNSDSG